MIAPLLGRIHRPGWVFGPVMRQRGTYDRGAVAAAGPLPRLRADCGALSGRKWIRCTHRDIGFSKRDEVTTRKKGNGIARGPRRPGKQTGQSSMRGASGGGTPPKRPPGPRKWGEGSGVPGPIHTTPATGTRPPAARAPCPRGAGPVLPVQISQQDEKS